MTEVPDEAPEDVEAEARWQDYKRRNPGPPKRLSEDSRRRALAALSGSQGGSDAAS